MRIETNVKAGALTPNRSEIGVRDTNQFVGPRVRMRVGEAKMNRCIAITAICILTDVLLASQAHAQCLGTDPLQALVGTWTFSTAGFTPGTQPFASAGRFVASIATAKAGNTQGVLSFTESFSSNTGQVTSQGTDLGRYQVNPDCSGGNMKFNSATNPSTFDFWFVSPKEIRFVSDTSGVIVWGVAKAVAAALATTEQFGHVTLVEGYALPNFQGSHALVALRDVPGKTVAVLTTDHRLQTLLETALHSGALIAFFGQLLSNPPTPRGGTWGVDVYQIDGVIVYNIPWESARADKIEAVLTDVAIDFPER
jgi:hypothetical protein